MDIVLSNYIHFQNKGRLFHKLLPPCPLAPGGSMSIRAFKIMALTWA